MTLCRGWRRQLYGTDSETGELCGVGRQVGRPYQYLPNPADPLGRRLCVSECPKKFSADLQARSEHAILMFGGPCDGDAGWLTIAGDTNLAMHHHAHA
jgi:hypothetical protein